MEDFLRSLSSKRYMLSPLDIIPSHLYITNAYFFENEPSAKCPPFMTGEALSTSFYHALQKFPILVGILSQEGLNAMSVVVDRNNPNMPVYEELNENVYFQDIKQAQFHREQWPKGMNIRDPRSQVDYRGVLKLIHVRVHRLAENSGVVIVVRISHSVFDAKGCVAFMNCWAEHCRESLGQGMPNMVVEPILDRRVMYEYLPKDVRPNRNPVDPRTWLSVLLSLLIRLLLRLYVLFSTKQSAPDYIESHMFRIPRSTLSDVREEAFRLRPDGLRVSDNDVITALFLMAFSQSTEKLFGSGSKSASAIVPCDFRRRIGMPDHYAGNCAIGLYVTAPRDALLSSITLKSLAQVASISRETVDCVDKKTVEQFIRRALRVINLVGRKANVLYSMIVCQAFSNQSRLSFYDVDFGFGRPAFVVPMAYSNTVAVIMPSASQQNDVYVFLTLRPNVMTSLLKNVQLRAFTKLVY
ncbi:transferase family protein [Patellaria atrata CBS 101060]|uniref:Transferase family protein n=1 Tax=Patellaria atrata CBS 101060 TaxID=1346257 RepID=A0A9P4VJK3_9PEZI|nr:transferase family protein [Patellaria atrata CBS 101060]